MVANILLPELVDCLLDEAKKDIIGNIENEYDQRSFMAYLVQVSQVSRVWYLQTRPYLFNRLRIQFGTKVKVTVGTPRFRTIRRILGRSDHRPPPTLASRRIKGLLDLVADTPSLGDHVRKVVLTGVEEWANQDLMQCNSALVALLDDLKCISSLKIEWNDDQRPTGEEYRWWSEELDEPSRAILRRIVTLPTLMNIDLRKVMLPPSVWMANTSLRWLSLWDRAIYEEQRLSPQHKCPALSTLSLISGHARYTCIPILLRVPHPSLLSALTTLIIAMGIPWLEDIQRVLSIAQGTLIYMSMDVQGEEKVDLSDLRALKELTLRVISVAVPRDIQSKFILNSLPTLPWRQLEMLSLHPCYRCPNAEHAPFNPLLVSGPLFILHMAVLGLNF